jgi:tight adherence protein B
MSTPNDSAQKNRAQVLAIRQLSNLISAGISPAQARQIASVDGAGLVESHECVDRELSLYWQLAIELGSPIADSLRHLADSREQQLENERQIQLAFATPSMTAKLINWLPIVSLLLAQAVGLNPFGAIASNLLVVIAVLVGLSLMATAKFWSNHILLAAKPHQEDPAFYINCVAMAIEAGLPPIVAIQRVQEKLFEGEDSTHSTRQIEMVTALLELSARTGAAAVRLLRSLADQERKEKTFAENEKIAKLNIKLLLPIGLAVLPAFGLLTIVPVAFGFLGSNQ